MRAQRTAIAAAVSLLCFGDLPAAAQGTLWTAGGDLPGDLLGYSVGGVGDVDADGLDDVIAGAPFSDANGPDAGMVRVFAGTTGAVLFTFLGDAAGDQMGRSVSGAGDTDGDGTPDFVAGAPFHDQTGGNAGSVRVFSGSTGAVLFTFHADSPGDRLGFSVRGAGDVDGDGFDDVIAGAPLDDDHGTSSGSVRVYSGRTGAVLFTFHGDSALDRLGWSVGGGGDVDGDGFADAVAGAPYDDDGGQDAGSVRVYSGATGAILFTFHGAADGDGLGWATAGIADADGDGFDDVVAGAPYHDAGGTDAGALRVYSGATGATIFTALGDSEFEWLGFSVDGAFDVDADGLDDVVAGAYLADDNGPCSGRVRAYQGNTGAVLATLVGASAFSDFGFSVGGAGDANGDGRADIVAGAPYDDEGGVLDGGSVRVDSLTCGDIQMGGFGCPGSFVIPPILFHGGCATPGAAVDLELKYGPGGAPAVVFVGTGSGDTPIEGCPLLVEPVALAVPIVLGGTPGLPGTGGFSISPKVPLHTAPGTHVVLQAFIADRGAPNGLFSASNSVLVTIE